MEASRISRSVLTVMTETTDRMTVVTKRVVIEVDPLAPPVMFMARFPRITAARVLIIVVGMALAFLVYKYVGRTEVVNAK